MMEPSTMHQPNQAPTPPGPQPLTPVRVMVLTLSVLFVLGMVWLLIQVRSILLLLILGILLASAIEPLVTRLRRRGLSRGQGIMAIYAIIFAIIGVGLVLIVPTVYDQSREFIADAPDQITALQTRATNSPSNFVNTIGAAAFGRLQELRQNLVEDPPIQVTQALGLVTSVIGVLFTTVSVMIVAFYWMTEKALIKRLALNLFPIEKRDRAHGLWDSIEEKLGGWARGQLVLMLVIGVISTIAYAVLGLPFWFLLGIWAGLTELIPFVGPFLGGGLAALVALTESWQKALIVVGFVLVLQQIEGNVLVPRVMRNAVGLTPLTVILAVLIGAALGGPIGAVLAIPVAAAVQVLLAELLRSREESFDTVQTGAGVAATLSGRPVAIPGGGIAHPAGTPSASYAAAEPPAEAAAARASTARAGEPTP